MKTDESLMTKQEILAMTDEELDEKASELMGVDLMMPFSRMIQTAWLLFESVYGRGGKIKGGSWVLSTVDGGRDVASATLLWKAQSGQKHRANKVTVICPRGEMAKAITQAWVCAMLGVSDV